LQGLTSAVPPDHDIEVRNHSLGDLLVKHLVEMVSRDCDFDQPTGMVAISDGRCG
jgi:hypothetical protein